MLVSTVSLMQAQEAAIRDTFDQYRTLTLQKDFDGLMDYIYPKLFDIVSRADLVKTFEQLDSEDMRFDFEEMDIAAVSPVFVYEDKQYALVGYSGIMSVWMLSAEMQEEETLAIMWTSFDSMYDSVESVKKDGIPGFRVVMNKEMYAIADKGKSNWTFAENNLDQPVLMDMLFPREVQAHFAKN